MDIETIDLTDDGPIPPIRLQETRANGVSHSESGQPLGRQDINRPVTLQHTAGGSTSTATAPAILTLADYTRSLAPPRHDPASQSQRSRANFPGTPTKRLYDDAYRHAPPAKAARLDHDCSQMPRAHASGRNIQTPTPKPSHVQNIQMGMGRFQVIQPTPPKQPQPAPPPHEQSSYPATSVQLPEGSASWMACQVAYRAISLLSGQRPDGGPLNWIAWYAGRALQDYAVLDALYRVAMQTAAPFQLEIYQRVGREGSSWVPTVTGEYVARQMFKYCPAAEAALRTGLGPKSQSFNAPKLMEALENRDTLKPMNPTNSWIARKPLDASKSSVARQAVFSPQGNQALIAGRIGIVASQQRLNTSLIRSAINKTVLWKCTEDAGFMQYLLRAAAQLPGFTVNIHILAVLEPVKQNPSVEFAICNFIEQQQQVYGKIFPRALPPGRQKPYVPRPTRMSLPVLQGLAAMALESKGLQVVTAVTQALALEAAVDGLLADLLSMVANGSASQASISAFNSAIQHVYWTCDISESTGSAMQQGIATETARKGVADVVKMNTQSTAGRPVSESSDVELSWERPTDDGMTVAAVTDPQAAATGTLSESVDEARTSELRVLATRVGIVQQHSKLPCLDATVKRMVEHARRDEAFAKAIKHVSGATGHLVPDQDQLLIVKHFIDDSEGLRDPGDGQPTPQEEASPQKLLLVDWPLPVTPLYQRYLKQNRYAPKSKINVARSGKPLEKYIDHTDCGMLGNDAHPQYPLSLLPGKTCNALHKDEEDGVVCSCCRRSVWLPPYQRKLFLVAERLACPAGTFGLKAREKNEQALWAVNFKLGIEEPADVSSQETVFGGKHSIRNQYYPILTSRPALQEQNSNIQPTPPAFALKAKSNALDLASEMPCHRPALSTPSSQHDHPPATHIDISLLDFYKLLDKIERTSPMATRFLDAYADRLSRESCSKCWAEENILEEELESEIGKHDS